MKPKLINKNFFLEILNKNNINSSDELLIHKTINDSNNNFFNFLIMVIFIIGILFLIYRYLEKKKCNDDI